MRDIFDAKLMCKSCNVEMRHTTVENSGFELRAVICPECKDRLMHPKDLADLEQYKYLKGKTYNVKLRMVGNSHAISIPKEVVECFNELHRRMSTEMNNMVQLSFGEFGKLSVNFIERKKVRKDKW